MVKELCQRQFVNPIIKVDNLVTSQKIDLIVQKLHLQVIKFQLKSSDNS